VGFVENNIAKEENTYKIFPNPITDNFLNISFNKSVNYSINYVIYNSLGVKVQDGFISRNTQNFRIELQNFKKGLYFISLSGKKGNGFKVKKFIY
jgi:hypothetical protein